jgi:hypothetical protein
MQVPDTIRKCVCFLFFKKEGESRLAGTAFFLGGPLEPITSPGVVGWGGTVTARHVIDGIMGTSDDGKVYMRLNRLDGRIATAETEAADWATHREGQTVDVAAFPFLPDNRVFDHLIYPSDHILTTDLIDEEAVGVGDEVFLAGLFANHAGIEQNIPIVRVGNIAAMLGEEVQTKLGPMEAYLIEARSMGGLSGSPVFVNLGSVRQTPNLPPFTMGRNTLYLLGVMHGHWDTAMDALGNETVNMGIAIVPPISKAVDILSEREEFRLAKKEEADVSLPQPDMVKESDDEPNWGREDFLSDLKRATRRVEDDKPPQGKG